MTVTRDTRTRALAAGLAFLVGLSFAAPPAFAADPAPSPSPSPEPSLAETAEATLDAMPSATLARGAQMDTPEPATAPSSPSFFKTGKGAAVLILLAGGVGYTVYSFSHDRVKSPEK